MNRALSFSNFAGLLAVAGLCVLQWRSIARIDGDRDRLELTRQSQSKQIVEETKTIADQSADLDDFRNRLQLAEEQLKDLSKRLASAEADRDQLKTALVKWKTAVDDRDTTIKQASATIESLVKQRDAAIAQCNDTASKYNQMVKKMSQ